LQRTYGEVLWSLGQRDRALAIWKEGLLLNAENETLQETLKRLACGCDAWGSDKPGVRPGIDRCTAGHRVRYGAPACRPRDAGALERAAGAAAGQRTATVIHRRV
jgi:hypothetical protein